MRSAAALPALMLLAACTAEKEPAPAPTPTATVTVAKPRTLVAADLDLATLGAKIAGPKGTDPEFSVMAGGKVVARVAAFVACPKAVSPCTPETLPADTIYTYVLKVTPDTAGPLAPTPAATPSGPTDGTPDDLGEIPAIVFQMTRPARGFKGGVGYARAEAEAALGAPEAISVTLDEERLIWRVTGGSGWKPGAPITLWWQSTVPPAGPQPAYRLEMGDTGWTATGPFPAEEKATDKAVDPAPAR